MTYLIVHLDLFTPKVCEMLVYKHTETIEYFEKQPTFQPTFYFDGFFMGRAADFDDFFQKIYI